MRLSLIIVTLTRWSRPNVAQLRNAAVVGATIRSNREPGGAALANISAP